jgi:hypothetical protein
MFDVSWGNPQTETVSQRKERKDREDKKSTRSGRRASLHSVDSGDSGNASVPPVPKGLGLFGRKIFTSNGRESPFKTAGDVTTKKKLHAPLEIDTVVAKADLQTDYFNFRPVGNDKDQSRESVGSNSTSMPTSHIYRAIKSDITS